MTLRLSGAAPAIPSGVVTVADLGFGRVPANDVTAAHLSTFLAATAPKVAIIGDSTSTETANPLYASESIWDLLQQAITRSDPSKAYTFGNYGIGSANWSHFVMTGTATGLILPSWFTDPSQTWISYVQTFAPDLLFVCAGINGVNASNAQFVKSFLANVVTWTKVPSIVFITNKARSVLDPTGASLVDFYPGTAAMVRTMARSGAAGTGVTGLPPLGVLDLGRYFTMRVLGYDPDEQYLSPVASAPVTGITSFPYTFPTTSYGDLDLQIVLPGQAATALVPSTSYFEITLAPFVSGGSINNRVRLYTAGGRIAANYYTDSGTIGGQTTIALPASGDLTVRVLARAERVIVICNGTVLFDKRVPRYITKWAPQLNWIGTPPNGTSVNVSFFREGQARKTQVAMKPADVWGTDTSDGNQINHLSSQGVMLIDAAVINATRWR